MCDVTRSSVGGIPRWGCSPRGEAGVGVPLGQPQDKAQSWGSEGDNRLWLRLYMLGEFRAVQWPPPVFLGFPCDSAGKESACNVGDLGSIPGLGRSTGEGNSYPTQYSGPQNYTDWTVHGVAKSRTWLEVTFTSLQWLGLMFSLLLRVQVQILVQERWAAWPHTKKGTHFTARVRVPALPLTSSETVGKAFHQFHPSSVIPVSRVTNSYI